MAVSECRVTATNYYGPGFFGFIESNGKITQIALNVSKQIFESGNYGQRGIRFRAEPLENLT